MAQTVQDTILSELRSLTNKWSNNTAVGIINTQNLNAAGDATENSAVEINVRECSTATIQVIGTYTGALSVQGTLDGRVWVTLGGTPIININTAALTATITSAANGIFQVDVSGFLKIRVTGLAAVTGTATITIKTSMGTALVAIENGLTITSITPGTTSGSLAKAEDAIHNSGDTGIMNLGVRYETLAAPNAAGDFGFQQVDDLGKLVMMPFAPLVNQTQGTTAAITDTADTLIIAAGAAGVRNYITSITIVNSSGVASVIELKDGSTVIWRGYVTANGYNHVNFPTPLKGTAATAINVACVTTATNTFVTCTGFRAL